MKSTAAAFHHIATLLDQGDQSIAVVTLNDDDAIFHRASGSALPLKVTRQFAQPIFVERDTRDGSHRLSFPALDLPANSHDSIAARFR